MQQQMKVLLIGRRRLYTGRFYLSSVVAGCILQKHVQCMSLLNSQCFWQAKHKNY